MNVPNFSVAVCGQGLVHGLGGIAELLELYKKGEKPATSALVPEPNTQALAELFEKLPLRRIPRYARMALLAAKLALRTAPAVNETRLGLVLGSAYASSQMSMDFMDSILDAEPRLSSPTAFSHAVNNMGAGLLSLYLGLRGPCCTVTQFDLSFAGALYLATNLLHSNRADAVLVGAVDEVDARFLQTCTPCMPSCALPHTAGAVFFLVTKPKEQLPHISVTWGKEKNVADTVFVAGEQRALYGESPIAQALDTVLALHSLQAGQHGVAFAHDAHTDMAAAVHIWR
jgi:hypothetical protein